MAAAAGADARPPRRNSLVDSEDFKARVREVSERTGVEQSDPLKSPYTPWTPTTVEWDHDAVRMHLTDLMRRGGLPGEEICDLLKQEPAGTCCFAGSSVLASVLASKKESVSWAPNDFDIFFDGMDDGTQFAEFCRKITSLGLEREFIYARYPDGDIDGAIDDELSDIAVGADDVFETVDILRRPVRTVHNFRVPGKPGVLQIIEKQGYSTGIAAIVSHFDFDVVKIGFDGTRVHASKEAVAAVEKHEIGIPTKLNLHAGDLRAYVQRLEKYSARGFTGEPRLIVVRDVRQTHLSWPQFRSGLITDLDKDPFELVKIPSDGAFAGMYKGEVLATRVSTGEQWVHVEFLRRPGRAVKTMQR